MDRIGLAGLTLHETDVEGLERLRRAVDGSSSAALRELADELAASEIVLLATCNRVELAYAREQGHLPGPRDIEVVMRALALDEGDALGSRPWIKTGRNAVHHVLRVASSLDSLVVGEDQILGQVRGAYETARDCGLVGPLLGPVYEAALQVGKEVRTRTDLSRHPVSVVSVGVRHLLDRCRDAEGGLRFALLGAGHMGVLVARCLRDAGHPPVLVANRTLPRAERLIEQDLPGAQAMTLDAFLSEEHELDGLVSVTGAPGAVVGADHLRRFARRRPGAAHRPFFAIDLAVPRDVEPLEEAGVEVTDLDFLRGLAQENRERRMREAEQAEDLVERKLERLLQCATDHHLDAVVAEALAQSSDILTHEIQRLLTGRLAHLGEPERRTVERWARSTFGRLAHGPLRAFKSLAAQRAAGISEEGEST